MAERLGVPHVATGELFRAAVRDNSPLGSEARRYMERGQLVPDELTIRMLLDRLDRRDAANGVVLDGFPRNRTQAEALDQALAERGTSVERALLIDVPTDDLVRRLSGRWICEASGHPYNDSTHPPRAPGICDLDGSRLIQREDDKIETVRARLAQQLGALRDVVAYYRNRGVLTTVDGARPVEAVADDLEKALGAPPADAARRGAGAA